MRFFARKEKKMRSAEIAEAQQQVAVSSQQAERDLVYQQARAHDERNNLLIPLRQAAEMNHIAEMIADSLIARYSSLQK